MAVGDYDDIRREAGEAMAAGQARAQAQHQDQKQAVAFAELRNALVYEVVPALKSIADSLSLLLKAKAAEQGLTIQGLREAELEEMPTKGGAGGSDGTQIPPGKAAEIMKLLQGQSERDLGVLDKAAAHAEQEFRSTGSPVPPDFDLGLYANQKGITADEDEAPVIEEPSGPVRYRAPIHEGQN